MEKEKKLDSKRIVSHRCRPQFHDLRTRGRLSWALLPNSDEPGEDATPSFLLQEIIFAHCPHDDLYLTQPRLQEHLLCRADWLCLRGNASCECAILPIQEIATHSRCSAQRSTARRSLPASKPINKLFWQPGENQQDNTNPTPTYQSCRDSYFRNSSSLTVRISLAHPFEETSSTNPAGSLRGIAGTRCDILPIRIIANY